MQLLHAPFAFLKIRLRANLIAVFLDGSHIFRTKSTTQVVATTSLQEDPCRFGNGHH
jgi:hypothetical protein